MLNNNNQIILPESFNEIFERSVKHNGIDVDLIRYEVNADSINYGSKNISFLIRKNRQLEGLSRLLPEFSDANPQLSQEESKEIAIEFLNKYAPDLLNNYHIEWIGKHSEEIIEDGKKLKLSGMKVKCRNSNDGLYFWVIVAPDGSVMVFERDVEWDFLRFGRGTEQWLHDDWLRKHK